MIITKPKIAVWMHSFTYPQIKKKSSIVKNTTKTKHQIRLIDKSYITAFNNPNKKEKSHPLVISNWFILLYIFFVYKIFSYTWSESFPNEKHFFFYFLKWIEDEKKKKNVNLLFILSSHLIYSLPSSLAFKKCLVILCDIYNKCF